MPKETKSGIMVKFPTGGYIPLGAHDAMSNKVPIVDMYAKS